jgi:hypothetical protein
VHATDRRRGKKMLRASMSRTALAGTAAGRTAPGSVSGHTTGGEGGPVLGTRSSVTVILTAALLSGSAVGVAAQEGDDGTADPVFFTVRFIPSDAVRMAEVTTEDGVTKQLGNCWAPTVVDPSDPRLAGDLTVCGDAHWFGPLEGSPSVGSGTYRLVNEEGAWHGSTATAEWLDPESGETMGLGGGVIVLSGEGAYEGLSAVLTFVPDWSDVRGFIFEGVPPAAPVPPLAE